MKRENKNRENKNGGLNIKFYPTITELSTLPSKPTVADDDDDLPPIILRYFINESTIACAPLSSRCR